MRPLIRKSIVVIGAAVAVVASATARPTIVTGTGNAAVDIRAVQAAVDQGGDVILTGHFSFDADPTTPTGAAYARMVTVSKAVVISGNSGANGDMPTINGGNWPFFVDAAGARVAIRGLHFIGPKAGAIWVYAVSGLSVANCRIEGVISTAEFGVQAGLSTTLAGGIGVFGDAHPPSANFPGRPENFSGSMEIVNNYIDMAGQPGALHQGIVMFSVGKSPDQEVDIHVGGNTVLNVTEPAIDLGIIGGRILVERNTITTGSFVGGSANPDALRILGSGTYLIIHNSIDCGWLDPAATGINIFGNNRSNSKSAIVIDNDVIMSAPEGIVFAANSAGIEVGGVATGIEALNNRVRGRAAAALSVFDRSGNTPANITFVANDIAGFQGSIADVFVDAGVSGTLIVGPQMHVQDLGSSTTVVTK
jgi:hypothetical protein